MIAQILHLRIPCQHSHKKGLIFLPRNKVENALVTPITIALGKLSKACYLGSGFIPNIQYVANDTPNGEEIISFHVILVAV